MNQLKRWDGLSLLKLISCIVVILLHCKLPGIIGDLVIYSMRFSVPCFLMISGYFAYGRKPEWALNKAISTARTLLLLEILYGLWTVLHGMLSGKMDIPAIHSVWDIVQRLLCGSFFNGTLWYLYALVFSWLIYSALIRFDLLHKAYAAILPLLTLHIVGRVLVQEYGDIESCVFLFRNVLMFGLPFMLIGSWCRQHEEALLQRMSLIRCILAAMLSGGIICLEYVLYGKYMDLHLSSVVLSFALFVGAMQVPVINGRIGAVLTETGRKLTGSVYYVHPFVMSVMTLVGISTDSWLLPLTVTAGSFLMAWLISILPRVFPGKARS